MDLRNSKFLDKNNYDSVLISDNSITFNCKQDYKTVSNKNKFSSSLKLLKDEEKRSQVLRHYLRNTIVMSINENNEYRGRRCITLNGTRILRTYVPLTSDDKKAILEKYEQDRIKIICEENYNSVHISIHKGNSECYLDRESDSSNKLSLHVVLCSNNEILLPREQEFLKRLISYLMGTNIGRYKAFHSTEHNYTRWIGNGITDINHDIICSINAEKIVYDEWFNQCSKKNNEEYEQITIEEYVKKLKI